MFCKLLIIMKLAFSSTPINYATYGALARPTLIIVFLDLLAIPWVWSLLLW